MKNYIPDNMGFPMRQTMGDMLPDESLVAPLTRSGRHEFIGYYKRVCHHCGKVFEATTQYRYRMRIDERERFFCRYNCMRPYEKAAEEQYRAIRFGFTKKNKAGKNKSLEQCAREHLAKCKQKLSEWESKRDNLEYWDTLTKGQKSTVYSNITAWQENVADAERTLKEVTGNE